MTTPGAILDLDGTLVDSNYLHVAAWWEAFSEHEVPVATVRVHQLLGRPSQELVTELAPDLSEELVRSVIEGHSGYYGPYLERIRPTPRAGELVHALARRGMRIVEATSAKPDEVDTMLGATGAAGTVHAVVDSGDAERGKPAPDPVALALRRGELERDRTVMLGDTVWDVLSARRAGLRCVALTCGGIDAATLRKAGASAVYRDPGDLLNHLETSPFAEPDHERAQ